MAKTRTQKPGSLKRSVRPDDLSADHCPNCDHRLDEPINDIWKDPNVKVALKEGRSADDIAVLSCPKCGRWGYYNQGSSFWCRFCEQGWHCCSEDEEPPTDRQYLWLDGFTTLADTVTVTTDGYNNETLPQGPNDQAHRSAPGVTVERNQRKQNE